MELIKELGRRIQKARKEKGLTQQELADLSHVSLKHVQGCERGVKNPSFEVLRAFCKVLNLSLDSLMNLDLPEDEQAANDMRQLYLSCPPAARKVLLNRILHRTMSPVRTIPVRYSENSCLPESVQELSLRT